jgi:hypothetical protein
MSGYPHGLEPSPHGDALLPNRTGGIVSWDYYTSGLARAHRWARAWKQSATIENKIALSALRVGKQEVSRLQARIAELEEALRSFTGETDHHAKGCNCRYCHAREVLDHE